MSGHDRLSVLWARLRSTPLISTEVVVPGPVFVPVAVVETEAAQLILTAVPLSVKLL
jgi:hypothetical protein